MIGVAIFSAWAAFYAVVLGLIFFGVVFRMEANRCLQSYERFLFWAHRNCFCLTPENQTKPYDPYSMPHIEYAYISLYWNSTNK